MRLKKYKVTIVERGRLVHIKTRGFGHPHSRCPLEDKDVTWCLGHVKDTSPQGQALLVADALSDRPGPTSWGRFFAVDSTGSDSFTDTKAPAP